MQSQPYQPSQSTPSPPAVARVIHLSFFLLGVINNFTFVIFVTAAEDLLLGYAGLILLCTVIPSFITRLFLFPFIHNFPYPPRIALVSVTSFVTTIFVALTPSIPLKLIALVIQAAVGAIGEISFLALTSQFDKSVVGMWSCGTGASGLLASGGYVALRNVLNVSTRGTLLTFAAVPLLLIVIYWGGLKGREGFESIAEKEEENKEKETEMLLTKRQYFGKLFVTYMLPLSVVYFAEYTINQGVLGTMTKFKDDRPYEVEKTYRGLQFTYQCAVFVSRSSISLFKIHALWVLPILQIVNLVLLTLSSMFIWLPNLAVAHGIVVWEGLLGGLTYVNAFYRLRDEAPDHLKEWALGTATVGDSAGISIAALVSIWLESAILHFRGEKS